MSSGFSSEEDNEIGSRECVSGFDTGLFDCEEELLRKRNVLCAVCSNVFRDPVLILGIENGGCQHSFCSECISHWMERSEQCPLCRSCIGEVIPDKNAQRRVSELPVHDVDAEISESKEKDDVDAENTLKLLKEELRREKRKIQKLEESIQNERKKHKKEMLDISENFSRQIQSLEHQKQLLFSRNLIQLHGILMEMADLKKAVLSMQMEARQNNEDSNLKNFVQRINQVSSRVLVMKSQSSLDPRRNLSKAEQSQSRIYRLREQLGVPICSSSESTNPVELIDDSLLSIDESIGLQSDPSQSSIRCRH